MGVCFVTWEILVFSKGTCDAPRGWLTFDLQDQIRRLAVADKSLRRDAPQVVLVVWLRGETHAASCHRHAAAGTQAALLQQLEAQSQEFNDSLFILYSTVWCVINTSRRRRPLTGLHYNR